MIDKKDLTAEEQVLLKKLYRKYQLNVALAVLLYAGFLFFANFVIILVDAMYIHSSQFRFLLSFGSTIIGMSGLRGTMEEKREIFALEVKERLGKV